MRWLVPLALVLAACGSSPKPPPTTASTAVACACVGDCIGVIAAHEEDKDGGPGVLAVISECAPCLAQCGVALEELSAAAKEAAADAGHD